MNVLLISAVCLGFVFSFSTTCFALPVHYSASGTIIDKQQQLLPISGWVNIDDQLRNWDGGGAGQPVESHDSLGQNQFYITGYSLQVGDYAFSGTSGHLYMEFILDPTLNKWGQGDLMWFLNDGTGLWNGWTGEYFYFLNVDGTAQAFTQYINLASLVHLCSFDYMFDDPILPEYSPDFSLWLTRQNPAPVPEPSTLILFGTSLLSLLAFRKIRQ